MRIGGHRAALGRVTLRSWGISLLGVDFILEIYLRLMWNNEYETFRLGKIVYERFGQNI
jgi:hypothetical protein